MQLKFSDLVKISQADSLSIFSAGSGIVDESTSPIASEKMVPGPDIFVCVSEFEPIIRLAQIELNRYLSPAINEHDLLRVMLTRSCLAY